MFAGLRPCVCIERCVACLQDDSRARRRPPLPHQAHIACWPAAVCRSRHVVHLQLQFAELSVWAAVCRTFSLQLQFAALSIRAAVCSAFSLGCSLQHFQFGLQFAALSVCSCSLQHFQFAAECLQSVHTMVVLKFYQLTCVHIKRTAQLATLTHPLST